MSRRDIGTDDPRVHVRPGRGSRPRTKRRPDYSARPAGLVIGVDRGRYDVVLDRDRDVRVRAVAARELGRGAVAVGDRVRLTGDLTGRLGTLARIALVEPRRRVLRRSLEEAPGRMEKVIVANADVLCIVASVAQPAPRPGLIDRCLVAAYEAGIAPVLVLTKCDLADPAPTRALYQDFDFEIVALSLAGARPGGAPRGEPGGWPDEQDDRDTVPDPAARCAGGLARLRTLLAGRFSVLVGHSGVGKSSLINALVPGAGRATGRVNAHTGHGRQTSTSARALALPGGGWVVDTPGVRSFGLAHVEPADVLAAFPEVAQVATHCLPLCTHLADEPSCALDAWRRGEGDFGCTDPPVLARRSAHVAAVRRLLIGLEDARPR